MKLLLLSEGPADVRDDLRSGARTRDLRPGSSPSTGGRPDADGRQGAVRVLVQRSLREHFGGRELVESEVQSGVLSRAHQLSPTKHGYDRKIELALVEAKSRGRTSVAIVVDQDRDEARLDALRQGVGRASQNPEHAELAGHTAVGVAIETVEAWLLADEKAVNDALAPRPAATACSPEGVPRPKDRFLGHARARTIDAAPSAHDAVAALVRLDVLRERCPRGWTPFERELRERAR